MDELSINELKVSKLVKLFISIKEYPNNSSGIIKTNMMLSKFFDEQEYVVKRCEFERFSSKGICGFNVYFDKEIYENNSTKIQEACITFLNEYVNLPIVVVSSFKYNYKDMETIYLLEKSNFIVEENDGKMKKNKM